MLDTLIVGVLTTAAASLLVWAEIHSRRNQVRQRAPEPVDRCSEVK